MSLLAIVKAVLDIVVNVGTGLVVGHLTGDAVKGQKGVYKACAAVAAVAIEGYVASKATGYLNDQIDSIQLKLEGPKKEEPVNG